MFCKTNLFCTFFRHLFYAGSYQKDVIEEKLDLHSEENGIRTYPRTYPVVRDTPFNMVEQYDILSNLSNYHWTKYITKSHGVKQMDKHSRFEDYRACMVTKRGTPRSIRNRFIYYSATTADLAYIKTMLNYHFSNIENDSNTDEVNVSTDVSVKGTSSNSIHNDDVLFTEAEQGVPYTTGNVSRRTISVEGRKKTDMSTFAIFKAQVQESVLKWRSHSRNGKDIICMPDYNMTTGKLIKNSFVHIHRQVEMSVLAEEQTVYTCSCKVYKLAMVHDSFRRNNNNACLHCIYFSTVIDLYYSALFSDNPNADIVIFQVLEKLLDFLNVPVVKLSAGSDRTKFFSVFYHGNQSCSIVQISGTNTFLHCLEPTCNRKNQHKRTMKTLLEEDTHVCSHLDMMKDNPSWLDECTEPEVKRKAAQKVLLQLCNTVIVVSS